MEYVIMTNDLQVLCRFKLTEFTCVDRFCPTRFNQWTGRQATGPILSFSSLDRAKKYAEELQNVFIGGYDPCCNRLVKI